MARVLLFSFFMAFSFGFSGQNFHEKYEISEFINGTDFTIKRKAFKEFKNQKLQFRIQISHKILLKYEERVPIIADCKAGISIDKNKYIVPRDLTIGQFLYILKKQKTLYQACQLFLAKVRMLQYAQFQCLKKRTSSF